MSKNLRTEAVGQLFEAILSLRDKEECYRFFEDICTINELLSLSQRFEVAKMLREQKTYLDIAEKTGASTATISRVNRSLNEAPGRCRGGSLNSRENHCFLSFSFFSFSFFSAARMAVWSISFSMIVFFTNTS